MLEGGLWNQVIRCFGKSCILSCSTLPLPAPQSVKRAKLPKHLAAHRDRSSRLPRNSESTSEPGHAQPAEVPPGFLAELKQWAVDVLDATAKLIPLTAPSTLSGGALCPPALSSQEKELSYCTSELP